MKKIYLAIFLALTFFQLHVVCQTITAPYAVFLPKAGQTLQSGQQNIGSVINNLELNFDSLNMAFSGNWPCGQSFSISASQTGDTLFIGEGGMMDVLDISDPGNPVMITAIRARSIIDDSYYDAATARLYLAAYFSGIEIWDVSDFNSPVRLNRIPTNSYPRGGVFARGNFVYIATVADGFYVADISDIENPVMVGHRVIPGNPLVWDSDYQGNFAYLAGAGNGLIVIDFSHPANPVIKATYPGMTTGLCVRDTLAFVASSGGSMKILNIKDPATISLLGSCSLAGNPNRVTVSGSYAYIANSTTDQGGINVVDISVPSSPVLTMTYPGFQTFIAGKGNSVASTGGPEGCLILDCTNPAQPVEAFAWPLAGFTYQLTVNGNFGYTGSNGFRVFDLTDKTNPIQVGFNAIQGSLAAIKDTVAVFIPKSMTSNNPVSIMDISDPATPLKIGQYMAPVMTYDLCLKGNYAFVGCWWDGIRVIDFSDPENPVLKSHVFGWHSGAVPGVDYCYVQTLDIYGNYLYFADYQPFAEEDTKGLYVFDITDPENPQFISRYALLMSNAQEIRVLGQYVYVADGNGGIEVIDVSDPLLPHTSGYCSLPDGATGVDISWPFVFISDYILGGVEVVDVSNPELPFVTAFYKPSGCFAMGVTVNDNYAYAGDGVAGFQVYDFLTATGIDDPGHESSSEISIFPNPSSTEITVEIPEVSSTSQLTIFNINGQELKKIQITEPVTVVEISKLPEGVYFVRLTDERTSVTKKMVVRW